MNASVPVGVPDRFSTPIPGETDEDRPGEGEIVIQDSPERFVNFVRFFFSLFDVFACLRVRGVIGRLAPEPGQPHPSPQTRGCDTHTSATFG